MYPPYRTKWKNSTARLRRECLVDHLLISLNSWWKGTHKLRKNVSEIHDNVVAYNGLLAGG